jgi:hypothetical protein
VGALTSLQLRPAVVRWRLDAPAGPDADLLVAGLVGAGCTVEPIEPGTAYRIDGPRDMLEVLADELTGLPGMSLQIEQAPPAGTIITQHVVAPTHPYRRQVTVHGTGPALSRVARAVDRGLQVGAAGVNRWTVTGRTAALVSWIQEVRGIDRETALTSLGMTAADVAAEDMPPLAVTVALPDRRIESTIERDGETGAIVNVTQLETTPR